MACKKARDTVDTRQSLATLSVSGDEVHFPGPLKVNSYLETPASQGPVPPPSRSGGRRSLTHMGGRFLIPSVKWVILHLAYQELMMLTS